jgi:drug/metabolite transporter (DMT)-like permease
MRSNLIFNERIKMAALFFNNIGIISMSTGVIAPIYEAIAERGPFELDRTSIIVLVLGIALAGIAQLLLGRLRG